MHIKILGTGCPTCVKLEKLTREVVAKSGINAEISKVEDIMDIVNYGVMRTPALVIDEQVVISGRLPSVQEIEAALIH